MKIQGYVQSQPEFTVAVGQADHELMTKLRKEQSENMRYFIGSSGKEIVTNSAKVVAQLHINSACQRVEYQEGIRRATVDYGQEHHKIAKCITGAIDDQTIYDYKQLFRCNIETGDVSPEQVAQSQAVEMQCHHNGGCEIDEVAWGDVNDCKLDPTKVRQAREADLSFFKKTRVYEKVRWVDTNNQG